MKIIKITLFLLCLSFSATAKDSTTVEFKRFAIGIHASPDYCYRKLSSTKYSTHFRDMTEEPMWGYTAGADVSYIFKKQFAVSLGVDFSQKGYRIGSIPASDFNGNVVGMAHIRYNYNHIQIPLKANFIFGKKKIHLITSIGIVPSFLLYQQTISKINYSDGSTKNIKSLPNYIYNPFNIFVNASIGIDYQFGKKMGLRIEPTYSYGLFQTIDSYITEHLWSAGLNVGCYIKL